MQLKILLEWIENFEQELWDKEFEGDVRKGKLDKLAKQAIRDFQTGKCRELLTACLADRRNRWPPRMILPFIQMILPFTIFWV